MFVTNWISTTKIQKISEITNFLGTISYPELRYKMCNQWCFVNRYRIFVSKKFFILYIPISCL